LCCFPLWCPRIRDRLLDLFFRTLISLFLSLWYHPSFWILIFLMKQELDVLMASLNAHQASEREEKIRCNDNIRNRTAATFIQSYWRWLLARKELQRLQKEATELSIQLVGDSRMNHLEKRGNNMIQIRSNSDFNVKSATIQFYGNNHNSQFDWLIGLKFYVESSDMFSYLGLKFQVNRSSWRYLNMGQQMLYEFCYLLPIWLGFFS